MTKLTAKSAELPQVSCETPVSRSFGFGSGASGCLYVLLPWHLSLRNRVRVLRFIGESGKWTSFQEIQPVTDSFHLRNLSTGRKIHASYNPANILYYCLPSIRRCIIFFHRELSYLSWSYVKSKKFKVQAQFLSRVYSNCFKCVQQVPGLSTASRCYHRKPASWTDDFLYWS